MFSCASRVNTLGNIIYYAATTILSNANLVDLIRMLCNSMNTSAMRM